MAGAEVWAAFGLQAELGGFFFQRVGGGHFWLDMTPIE
jgi:hypothetical protein